ncbi:MAG: hypothetical protein ACJ8OJ_12065 [Povalibacter sp.]
MCHGKGRICLSESANIPKPDLLAIIALAIPAYALANFAHEGLGHGGACVLVGCTPHLVTSIQFDGDYAQLPASSARIIEAGGSIMNLVCAVVAATLLRRSSPDRPARWLFLWLFGSLSLMQATGYLLFSGVGNVGDWASIVSGLPGGAVWKIVLIVVGGVTYWLSVRWSMRRLGLHLSTTGGRPRAAEAYRYTLVAYITGAVLYVVAGSFDPAAQEIILISGVAASLGGTSGFAWGPQMLRNPNMVKPVQPLAALERDWRWITVAVVCAAIFVAVLGPGVRF